MLARFQPLVRWPIKHTHGTWNASQLFTTPSPPFAPSPFLRRRPHIKLCCTLCAMQSMQSMHSTERVCVFFFSCQQNMHTNTNRLIHSAYGQRIALINRRAMKNCIISELWQSNGYGVYGLELQLWFWRHKEAGAGVGISSKFVCRRQHRVRHAYVVRFPRRACHCECVRARAQCSITISPYILRVFARHV